MTTTTNTPAPARPLPGWLKAGLLAVLVFGAVWAIAFWYWDAAGRSPTTPDLVLYLLALPLALLMASGFARTRLATPAAAPAASAPVEHAPALQAPPSLAMLAAALRSPHGQSPEELSASIARKTARADLDPELVDADGFPIMAARSADAVDAALQAQISEWWSANGHGQQSLGDAQWRALTMASAVAGELASRAARDLMPPQAAPPVLQLQAILPPGWPAAQRRAARMWLEHTVVQSGWPQARIASAEDTQETTPPQVLGRLAEDAAGAAPLAAIVVACASNISEESVGRWAGDGCLFTPSRPQGLIPGEGAAGLLVSDTRLARSLGDAFALLEPVTESRLAASADEARRTDAGPLAELAERVIRRGAVEFSDVGMVVADTGHRANRTLELMGFAARAMPQLDGDDDVACVGTASGTCGAVPFMAALALARHHALERNAPVLCVSNEDPWLRCAALIRPSEPAAVQASA